MKSISKGETTPKQTELELLQAAFKTGDTGIKAMDYLLKWLKEKELCLLLVNQTSNYKKICNEIRDRVKELGENPDDLCPTGTTMLKLSVYFKCMMDKSTQNLAKMAYQGGSMGIVELNHLLNIPKNRDIENSLAKKMLEAVETSREEYVQFL